MATPCTSVPRQTARVTEIEKKDERQTSERDDRETERAKDRKSERE